MSAETSSEEFVVGPAAEIPVGTSKKIQIKSVEVGVYNVGGTFYAVHNSCPHQYGPVCNGRVGSALFRNESTHWIPERQRHGKILVCPWHGIEFDITTGQSLAVPKYKVRTFPVRVVDGEVRVVVGSSRARSNGKDEKEAAPPA